MKKVLAMILSLVMLLGLVACGEKKPDQPEQPEGPTEIVMWSVRGGEDAAAIQTYIDEFNASQDKWNLTMVYTGGYADTQAKFQTAAAGDRPDLVDFGAENCAYFFDNPECYVPVQKFIDEDNYDASNILAHARYNLTDAEGNLIGVPLGNSAVGFVYNGDLLAAAGIDPHKDLNSLEDLAAAADKLQANGVKYPVFVDYDSTTYDSMLAAQGLALVDNNNGYDGNPTKTLLGEEPLKSATTKFFSLIQSMAKKGQLPPSGLSGSDLRQMVVNGELAIFCWTVTSSVIVGDLCNWELDIGFHPSMTIDSGAEVKGQGAYGGVLVIGNNNDDNRARGAWEFLKVFLKDENVVDFALISSYLPTTESAFNSDQYQAWMNEKLPSYQYTADVMADAKPNTGVARMPNYGDVQSIMTDIVTKVLDDHTYTPEQATADLQSRIDESIQLYNLSKGK